MAVRNYYEEKGYISASFLKELSNSPQSAYSIIKGEETKKSPALDYGSLVDCLLTTPNEFDLRFKVFKGTKPSDRLLDFANKYIEIYQLQPPGEEISIDSIILQARSESGYDKRLLNDTVIKKFNEECSEYCQIFIDNPDKVIIDTDTYNLAEELVTIAKASPYLQNIFRPNSNTVVLFQVPIFVNTTKFDGKALLDVVIIDLENKTITPYDFKTFEGSFESNYWKYKYYYQEAWYGFLLKILQHSELFVSCDIPEELKVIHSKDFTIEQFKFIALDKSFYKEPEIFESYSNIIENVTMDGYINKEEYKVPIKSIMSLIKESKDRVRIGNWTTDYDMLTKGIKKLWL